eukprot:23544-Prorocentrum_minimum.AAC.1
MKVVAAELAPVRRLVQHYASNIGNPLSFTWMNAAEQAEFAGALGAGAHPLGLHTALKPLFTIYIYTSRTRPPGARNPQRHPRTFIKPPRATRAAAR